MSIRKPVFTIDWEPYFCYRPYSRFWEDNDPLVDEPTHYLLDILRRHQIKAIWYCVGWLVDKRPDLLELIRKDGHTIGCHTYYHKLDDNYAKDLSHPLFRSPRFKGQKRLYSGGFWFRALPYVTSKKLLEASEVFFIHPHDVLLEHPPTGSIFQDIQRSIGLKTVRDKLERLCREVTFEDPILQPS